ncbi:MAG TPA: FGGY-family carbohydrate kinase [Acidimicrobiales bacterium]|jgi:xylulokinase|nr:FGGY-family carbohydrate kinase [Acidimicrobiales bacterium]
MPNAATPLRPTESTAPHVLAVDLGTGGPKVAVLASNGRVVAHAFQAVGIDLTDDGGAEQSPQAWWEAIVHSARRAVADSGVDPADIVGIGCTSQWSGTVPVDAAGDALGPAITWMDSRGARAVRETVRGALNVQGYSAPKLAKWVRRTGGIPSLSGKDPVGHIHFLREQRPDVYAATAVFLEPVDYLNLRLTGLARASHDSITLHWVTDNRDINKVAYDDGLLELAGLERAKLPDLVPTGSVVGGLAPAAATELGLLPGTPVVAGTGDLHSAAVGSGAVDDFDGHLYIGTSSWISCHVQFKKTDALTNIASFPSGIPGRYLVVDEHETGGACLTWLRDNMLFPDDALAPPTPAGVLPAGTAGPPAGFFGLLNDIAAGVPVGSHGVMFTPWLNGERSPVDDHTIRGGFHNISLSSTRSDMVRAVFEGVALNSAWLLGAVEKYCKRPFTSLAFVGGGANSDLWSQIHADAMGRTIRQIDDPVLANVRGAGLLTLLALGHLTVADIPGTVTVKSTYEPDPVAGEVYAALLKEFVNFYEKTKGIHKRLNGRRLHQALPATS